MDIYIYILLIHNQIWIVPPMETRVGGEGALCLNTFDFSLVLPRMARIENCSISNHISSDVIRATAVAAILRGNVSRLKISLLATLLYSTCSTCKPRCLLDRNPKVAGHSRIMLKFGVFMLLLLKVCWPCASLATWIVWFWCSLSESAVFFGVLHSDSRAVLNKQIIQL